MQSAFRPDWDGTLRPASQVGCEDEVYRAAAAYVEGRGGELTEEERRGVWGCVRFAWCSAEAQVR